MEIAHRREGVVMNKRVKEYRRGTCSFCKFDDKRCDEEPCRHCKWLGEIVPKDNWEPK